MDFIMQIWSWLSSNWPAIFTAATSLVTAASAIAAITKTPKDDKLVGWLYKIIDWLAINIGRAKDKPGESK